MAGVPPLKNSAYSFEVCLVSQADTDIFQANPTLAAGDVKVSKDGGSLSNITSLPTAIDSGKLVTVALSATEMNADRVVVLFSDAAGDEWQDLEIFIPTETQQINDLSTLDAAGVRTAVGLASANLDTQLGGLPTDADVQTAAAAALTAYDPPTNAEMEARTLAAASYFDPAADIVAHVTLVDTTTTNTDMRGTDGAYTGTPPSAADNADAVWDEAKAGHVAAGSFGEEVQSHALSSEISALNDLDAAGVRSAVGLASANLDTQLGALPTAAENRAEMDSNSTQLAAIVADTGELQTDWVDGGRLDLILDAISTAVTSAIAEITGVSDIPATPTLRQALMLLYMAERNNTQSTSTERRILNDAGTEVLDATMSDDGTTFSRGKLGAA